MQAVRMASINRQNGPATPFSVSQSAGAMVPNSVTEQGFKLSQINVR
jgi:hypothetical protein